MFSTSSPTQRLLLKYDASTVLSEHLMSESTVFVVIYNLAGGGVRRRHIVVCLARSLNNYLILFTQTDSFS